MDFIGKCLLILLLAIPILYVLIPSRKQRRMAKYLNKLPGPLRLPLIGTAWSFISVKREDLHKCAQKQVEKWGLFYRTWLGNQGQVSTTNPEHFEIIMSSSKHIQKSTIYDTFKFWLGDGLLVSKGEKWHRNRKLLTPTFHFKILQNFLEVFNEKSKYLVGQLESKANGEVFDIFPHISYCALDIICETAMGIEINAMENGESEYIKAIYDVSKLGMKRLLQPWDSLNCIYNKTADGKRFNQCLDIMYRFTTNVLNNRKKLVNQTVSLSKDDAVEGKKSRLAFLDLLLEVSQDGKVLSDTEIRDEISTFMLGGHDTTATALGWTLFLLGNNPDILKRVQQELEDLFHGEDRNTTIKDLGELKYLERVIKESLRLYPSIPTISRQLTEDITINGFLIPADVNMVLHIYLLHRDPKIYPNPNKFDPDRFLPENSVGRHPYAYVPFSAGPRNCIGQKFAMYEEKTLLAWILRKYKIKAMETPESIKLTVELVMKPQNGLKVILEPI